MTYFPDRRDAYATHRTYVNCMVTPLHTKPVVLCRKICDINIRASWALFISVPLTLLLFCGRVHFVKR